MDTTNKNQLHQNGQNKAFSLIELTFVISIVASLTILGAPSLATVLRNNSLTTHANELIIALNMARQTAITKSTPAFLCHTNQSIGNNSRCNHGNNSAWHTGYLLYHAPLFKQTVATITYGGSNQQLVKLHLFGDTRINIVSNTAIIGFDAQGFLLNSTPVNLTLCDKQTSGVGRLIQISRTGNISLGQTACT